MIFLLALETEAMSVTEVEHFSISDYALVSSDRNGHLLPLHMATQEQHLLRQN
jgi:hypothetical protein